MAAETLALLKVSEAEMSKGYFEMMTPVYDYHSILHHLHSRIQLGITGWLYKQNA